MNKLLFTFAIIFLTYQGLAQEKRQISIAPDTSRFEIVQSELGVRYTFKIDKYSGRVFHLVTGDEGLKWKPIVFDDETTETVVGVSQLMINEKNVDDWKVGWQLFLSGHGVRYTFLIDVRNGTTWQLVQDTETERLFWMKID